MNVTDSIRAQAQHNPDAHAVVRLDDLLVSYRDFDRTIDLAAARILAFGMRPGQAAVIGFPAPYKYLVVSLALARIGVATVPSSLPPTMIDACFAETAEQAVPGVQAFRVTPEWFQVPERAATVDTIPSHQDGAATCVVFPSSGTTGVRKHVALSHDMLARRIADKLRSRPLPADAREISSVGIGGGYGFRNIMSVFNVGGLMIFTHSLEHLAASIDRHTVNFLVTPPSTLAALAEMRGPNAGPYPTLRGVEAGGSLMSPELHALASERVCANILTSYGSTEASVVATAPMRALAGNPGAVGYVLPGVEVEAVDANDRPVTTGTEGLLRIRSVHCVSSYVGDPDATASAFRNGWFYPGDIGSVSADGLMRVAGRASEIINSGGDKIAPQLIEDVLSKLHGVKEVAAFGVPGLAGVTEVWAAIVANGTINADALVALCRDKLRIMTPRRLMRVDAIPRNENGKVQRDVLAKMAIAQRDAASAKAS